MTNEERTKASKDQILRYLFSYYPQWRVVKISAIKKILDNKYEFFKDIIPTFKQPDDDTGAATIPQELTNGLIFNALAECLQYIEDLFLLVKCSKDQDWFIKNIVTYRSGRITNFIESFDSSTKSLCKFFLFPLVSKNDWPNRETRDAFDVGVKDLKEKVDDIKLFFKEYKFFYNQYKHGLTIALRPYGIFDKETIDKKKLKRTSAYIVACDNLSIDKIIGQSDRFKQFLAMPCLTPNTKKHLNALQAEDNLLRFLPYKDEIVIEDIIDCAMKVRSVILVLINNLVADIQGGEKQLRLPKGDKNTVFHFTDHDIE